MISKLMNFKKEYEKPKMKEEQLEQLKARMDQANAESLQKPSGKSVYRYALVAASFLALCIILPNTSATVAHAMEQIPFIGQFFKVVTFRDYQYDSDKNHADIQVPEIELNEGLENGELKNELGNSTSQINAEIKNITDKIIAQFESYLENEKGYHDVVVKNEVLATAEDYFTLKLLCYEGTASGYESNYYYTIDLNTGERMQLKDIFAEGADYITPISENIKSQMQEQMKADDSITYWLNEDMAEMNFQAITDETSFYLNKNGNVVIAFNEGDVAPMYMGAVEFEIPAEVLSDIRK